MSCGDCWEWFVEFVIRAEMEDDTKMGFDDDGHQGNSDDVTNGALSKNGQKEGNFKKDRMKQLFNKHGFNLAIFPGGLVKGKKERNAYCNKTESPSTTCSKINWAKL